MTRDEARERLRGSWAFTLRDGRVLVRDPALLDAVAALAETRLGGDDPVEGRRRERHRLDAVAL